MAEVTLNDLGWLFTTGKVLSALSLLLLLAALVDARRRKAFPEVAYGGLSLSVSRVRVLWIGVRYGHADLVSSKRNVTAEQHGVS